MSTPRAVDSLAPIPKQNFHRKATRASSYSETKSGGQGEADMGEWTGVGGKRVGGSLGAEAPRSGLSEGLRVTFKLECDGIPLCLRSLSDHPSSSTSAIDHLQRRNPPETHQNDLPLWCQQNSDQLPILSCWYALSPCPQLIASHISTSRNSCST